MDAILQLHDTRSITYLLMMALYCLRSPKDPGAWCVQDNPMYCGTNRFHRTLAGLAVRLCIELGLHRKSNRKEITLEKELEKRLFWSCYYVDREVSMALGMSKIKQLWDSD